MRKNFLILFILILFTTLAGCGKQEDTDLSSGVPVKLESSTSKFAEYHKYPVEVNPSVEPYDIETGLSNVSNRDMFDFSPAAKKLLEKNGFVVVPAEIKEFYSLYESNRYLRRPSFITIDSMLHNYHLFFDRLLKVTERDELVPKLKKLTQSMLNESKEQYNELKDTEWESAALRNVGFFAVSAELLNLDVSVPSTVKDEVNKELGLIEAQNEIAPSPLMNRDESYKPKEVFKEDYTQYLPRGHYTESRELESYFKAMMWYGRMTFRVKSEDETKSAILVTTALNRGDNLKNWEDIYAPTKFFVGQSDDVNYQEYSRLLQEVYGDEILLQNLVENNEKFNEFLKAAQNMDPPAINSVPIYDENLNPDREEEIQGFRFMGQRFTLDAFIFDKLVYRDVKPNSSGERRMLPKGLDIPAAMGSSVAYNILESESDTEYKGYPENMNKLQNFINHLDANAWTQNLYWGWLYTLEALTGERGKGYPSFMQNQAWSKKELNTFLSSWTELKHDTILYSKQVYAEMGGPPERDDRGYVEPSPRVYARIASLCKMTVEGLASRDLISKRDLESLKRLEKLALSLKTISEKELSNMPLTEEEHNLIRSYGGQLEHFWLEAMRDKEEKDCAPSSMKNSPAAIVADIATDPEGRQVLEEATGNIFEIYSIVPIGDSLRIAKGGVYSHYEFSQPIKERLTNEAWHEMLEKGDVPPFDEWKKDFIAVEK